MIGRLRKSQILNEEKNTKTIIGNRQNTISIIKQLTMRV